MIQKQVPNSFFEIPVFELRITLIRNCRLLPIFPLNWLKYVFLAQNWTKYAFIQKSPKICICMCKHAAYVIKVFLIWVFFSRMIAYRWVYLLGQIRCYCVGGLSHNHLFYVCDLKLQISEHLSYTYVYGHFWTPTVCIETVIIDR